MAGADGCVDGPEGEEGHAEERAPQFFDNF